MLSRIISDLRIVLTATFVLSFLCCFSQAKVTVRGQVTEAESKLPIPFAHVFFNNTTLGAVTDSEGRYTISGVPVELKDIIASSIGYATLRTNLVLQAGKTQVVDFKMLPDNKVLSALVVRSRRDVNTKAWKRQFDEFKKIFLGESSNAASTEILNPFSIYFIPTEHKDSLIAESESPLLIENRALGYSLTITLNKFKATHSGSHLIVTTTKFDTLSTTNSKERERWQRNRIKTYKGSTRHLFKSIKDGRYVEEGYRIFAGVTEYNKNSMETTIVPGETPALISNIYPDTANSSKVLRKGLYQINYINKFIPGNMRNVPDFPFPVSWIEVKDSLLTLLSNGETVEPANYIRMGYMNSYRVADMLPHDFDPAKEETHLVLAKQLELSSIRGFVKDEKNNPLAEVEVFITNGLAHTTTNRWGQFEIPNLLPGRYMIGFADVTHEKETRVTDLVNGENSTITVQLSKPKNLLYERQWGEVWQNTLYIFERKWRQESNLPGGSRLRLVNPYVLLFAYSKKRIDIKSITPLIFESGDLGYQWKYYLDSAVMKKRRGAYTLSMSGLVRMDTLAFKSKRELYRFQSNRYDAYRGSWNNFTTGLIEGRATDEGFKAYQLKKLLGKKKIKFKKLGKEDIVELKPDSLLNVQGERFTLSIPKGLEIHYHDKKGDQQFYKRYSERVLRLDADSLRIPISANGSIGPNDLRISGMKNYLLKKVPVDYKLPYEKVTDKDVLVFVKSSNLKSVRGLLEKAYVQTDRPYYYAGDTIWLKAYLKYSNFLNRDSLSTVLYLDLVNPKNYTISHRLLKITDGQASGDFVLPYDLPAGDYYIRAYTNWMRNFAEIFVRPLPVLSRDKFIVSPTTDTTSVSRNLKVVLKTNKETYHLREPVELALHVGDDQGALASSLSVSVTDESAVADLNGLPTIVSLDQPFKADSSKMIRLKYRTEKGINFTGKVQGGFENESYSVNVIFPKGKTIITKVPGDKFRLSLDISDTLTAVIQSMDRSGSFHNTDIDEKRDTLDFFVPPAPFSYQLNNNTTYTRNAINFGKDSRMLESVIVKAKRISTQEKSLHVQANAAIQARYGLAFRQRIIEGQQILNVRTYNLITTLNAIIPNANMGFQNAPVKIRQDTGRIGRMPMDRNLNPGFFRDENSNYDFYLDGQFVNFWQIESMPTVSISRIEVSFLSRIPFPGQPIGVVAIYTEAMVPLSYRNFDKYLLRGYDTSLTFKTPGIKSTSPDYRTTLYWNPQISTDLHGDATIQFRTSDVSGKYKVTIEGVTETGEFFRVVKRITVVE